MAGFLHGEELAAAYASSDIFVMPSRTETLGLVVLEAMCSSLPVVAVRAGGIPEMIEDGVSGYLFDTTAEAIATIGELLESEDRRRILGDAAREHASHDSWRAATIQLVEQYKLACERQPAAVDEPQTAGSVTLGGRMKKTLKRSTMYAIRRLLP
jgi:glycosyltransferase involved in cell wall biosynthesis